MILQKTEAALPETVDTPRSSRDLLLSLSPSVSIFMVFLRYSVYDMSKTALLLASFLSQHDMFITKRCLSPIMVRD